MDQPNQGYRKTVRGNLSQIREWRWRRKNVMGCPITSLTMEIQRHTLQWDLVFLRAARSFIRDWGIEQVKKAVSLIQTDPLEFHAPLGDWFDNRNIDTGLGGAWKRAAITAHILTMVGQC